MFRRIALCVHVGERERDTFLNEVWLRSMSVPLSTSPTRANCAIEGRGDPFHTAPRTVLPPFPPRWVPTGPDTGTSKDRNNIFVKIALGECHNFGVRIYTWDSSFCTGKHLHTHTGREGVVLHMHTKLPFKQNCFKKIFCERLPSPRWKAVKAK